MKNNKTQKVLLIFPPTVISNVGNVQVCIPPLGIAYLGGYLREQNYEVILLDAIVEGYEYLVPYNEKYNIMGLPVELIKKRIKEIKPDVVGVSCLFSNQITQSNNICKAVKEIDESIVTVIGGAHATFQIEQCMNNEPSIDYIVLGEGEASFTELLDCIGSNTDINNIDGIVYRDKDKILINKKSEYIRDINTIPLPALDLLPMDKYFKINITHDITAGKRISMPVMTSRGCPGKCIFCSSFKYWGNNYRVRSAERVLDEIEYLYKTYKVEHIEFVDDSFTANKKRIRKIFKGFKDRDLNITWSTPNAIQVNTLDEELLKDMKNSGCESLTLAVESGNQEYLTNYIKKKVNLKKLKEMTCIMKKLHLNYNIFCIVGFPNETKEQILNTFKYAYDLDPLFGFFFLASPIPGSELYDIVVEKGYLKKDFKFEENDFGRSNFKTEHFSSEELEDFYYEQYTKYLFKNLVRHPIQLSPYMIGDNELASQAFKVILRGFKAFYKRKVSKNAIWNLLINKLLLSRLQSMKMNSNFKK